MFENMIDNSPEKIRLRRSQDTLVNAGTGVVAFGLWTMIKSMGVLLLNKAEIVAMIRGLLTENSEAVTDTVLFDAAAIVAGVWFVLGMLLHMFVGFSAIREGRGKRCFFLYLPATVIMIIASFETIVSSIRSQFDEGEIAMTAAFTGNSTLAGVVTELTSMFLMIAMLVAATRVRKYKRAVRAGERAGAGGE